MITLKTYRNLCEAQIDRSFLEAEGLRVFLADEISFTLGYGAVLPSGGIRLQVDESDEPRASELLKNKECVLPDDFIPPVTLEVDENDDNASLQLSPYPIWPIILVILALVISAFAVVKMRGLPSILYY
jgi:hypothetical protein